MKACYFLPELAELAGVTVPQLVRMLARSGVQLRGGGRKGATRYVLLADLRRIDPDLWDSIRLASDHSLD